MKLNEISNVTQIELFLRRYGIENYVIRSDGLIDVNGSVGFYKTLFSKIPFKFGRVTGDFAISECDNLLNLENSPTKVDGEMFIRFNESIRSLKGGPVEVGSITIIDNRDLRNTKFFPKIVHASVDITESEKITVLEELPDSVYDLTLRALGITSLKGCPTTVKNYCDINECENLESLEFLPTTIGNKNDGILNISELNFDEYPKLRTFLMFFKIKNLSQIESNEGEVDEIMTKHLSSKERDMIECQEELIEAGFKDYARLK